MRKEPQTPEHITNLQLEIVRYQTQISELENVIGRMKEEISESTIRFKRRYGEQQRQLHQSELSRQQATMEYRSAKEECETLSHKNLGLLEYIALTRDPQPVHTDNEYTRRIQRLDEMTRSWIGSLSKSRQSEDHELDQSIVKQALELNHHGRIFGSLVSERPYILRSILQNRRRRNSLIRQLIWAELSEMIFRPFCFGLRDDVSDLLSDIVDTIYSEEKNFSNVLLVRQVLGRGVLKTAQTNQGAFKAKVEGRLEAVMSCLFPEAKNLKEKLQVLVGEAIDLANVMAAEKCLFFCQMVSVGEAFNPEEMETHDEGDGPVIVCMFPKFGLRVTNEGASAKKTLVKATVELSE